MPKPLLIGLIVYLSLISVISVAACIYDKLAAKVARKHRTREAVLLLLSALGGSVPMLLTMLVIRHKTKHLKFMLGIPLIILLQAALILLLCIIF